MRTRTNAADSEAGARHRPTQDAESAVRKRVAQSAVTERKIASTLRSIYYNPKNPYAYCNANDLLRKGREKINQLTAAQVKHWLKSQDTHTLHRNALKNFPRNRVVAHFIDEQWDADLVDMQEFAKYNDEHKYLLTVIDILSKYAWAIPLKSKEGDAVVDAFLGIFNESQRIPVKLRTDRGKEFVNARMAQLCAKFKVNHFLTHNYLKACVAERFNRTLKGRMWKHFSSEFTFAYMSVIQDLVNGYNHRRHRMIKMCPAEVNHANEAQVYATLFPDHIHQFGPSLYKGDAPVGTYVRLVLSRGVFHKGYTGNFSEEIFQVARVNNIAERTRFYLKDLAGDSIPGCHYREELQPVNLNRNKKYVIQEILKQRRVRGKVEYFVKWFGYSDKHNSWREQAQQQQQQLNLQPQPMEMQQRQPSEASAATKVECDQMHVRENLQFIVQTIAILVIIVVSLYNISVKNDQALWLAMFCGVIGYSLPAPELRNLKATHLFVNSVN